MLVRVVLFFSLALCCGEAMAKQSLRPVVMQLDWIFNAQFAGLYMAIEEGYFAQEGIEVELRPVLKGQDTVAAVMEKSLPCFGSAESNVLMKGQAAGADIKALATMFQGSPMGWMYKRSSGIESIADFEGKHIGVHPDGVKVVEMAFARNGLNHSSAQVEIIGHDVGILLRGELDIMQGYYIDEYVKLQLQSKEPIGMILAKDHGYSTYSQVVFAPTILVESEPMLVRSFLKALQAGWEAALENPESAVDLIVEKYNPEIDRAYQIESLDKIGDLVKPNGIPAMAVMKRSVWDKGLERFAENGVLNSEDVDLDSLLDFSFNP